MPPVDSQAGDTPATDDGLRLLAPAKVNLTLAVSGRRADGFHELRTVMLALDLCDELHLRLARDLPLEGSTLAVSGPAATADIPLDSTNLALAGALAAASLAHEPVALEVSLTKHLPSGAGLGGGSSDAAAAFLGAARLLGVDPHTDEARAALRACGSDCAFFMEARHSGMGLCEGRGEVVTPLPSAPPSWHVALFTPDVHVATDEVYGALSGPLSDPGGHHRLQRQELDASAEYARAFLFNQLEEAALRVSPELVAWRACLDSLGLEHFRLAGSGASFFGLFDDGTEAHAALSGILASGGERGLATRFSAVTRPAGAIQA